MADYTGGGFIMIQRLYQNTRSYSDPDANHVYIHCQMRANITPVTVHGVRLERGQFLTSIDRFASECGMDESKMRRILKKLEGDGLIIRESAGKVTEKPTKKATEKVTDKPTEKATKNGTVITIVNYGLSGIEQEKSDGETDGETDEESDGESDGQTDDSIIIDNKEPISKKEENYFLQGSRYKEGTDPKGVPPLDSVASSSPSDRSFVKNPEAISLAEILANTGFEYAGHGAGGLPGYLARQLNMGYTREDILNAYQTMCQDPGLDNVDNHVGYIGQVLASMYQNGQCERGYFLTDKPEKIRTTVRVKETMDFFKESGLQFSTTETKRMVKELEDLPFDDFEVWDLAEQFVERIKDDPDRIKYPSRYFRELARSLYPFDEIGDHEPKINDP